MKESNKGLSTYRGEYIGRRTGLTSEQLNEMKMAEK